MSIIEFPEREGGEQRRKLTLIERAALRSIQQRQLEELEEIVASMKALAAQLGPETSPELQAAIKHSIGVLAARGQFVTKTLQAARHMLRHNCQPSEQQQSTPPTEPAA